MSVVDTYFTIAAPVTGEYKEKGSKFLAYAYPFDKEEELTEIIKTLKSEHPKARHHCYAYQIGVDGEQHRANDDGEPSGTAGRPILGQIKSHGLTNVLVVVVRYFGGTKLGASGLIQAYKEATHLALSTSTRKEKFIEKIFTLRCSFDHMGVLLNHLKKLNIEINDKVFDHDFSVDIALRKSIYKDELIRIKANLLEVSLDQVNDETEVSWCAIQEKEEVHA